MITRRIVINVVAFLLLSTVLILALVVTIFRVKPRYTVTAQFAESGGVFTGQEVTYRGVTVGRVGTLTLTRDGVAIPLVIEKDYDEIPADARARVMFKSAVGEQFVDLSPQSSRPPFLRDGDEIPRDRTDLPVQQEELLRLLAKVLDGVPPEAIGNLVETLGTGLSGKGDELHDLVGALDPITAVTAERTAELNDIATEGDRLGAAFDRSASDFVAGARAGAIVSDTLGDHASDLQRLLRSGTRNLPVLGALLDARKNELSATIANLAQITRISYAHLDSVKDTLKWLPLFLAAGVQAYDAETNRFRFGLVSPLVTGNPPCSYGTPRRGINATGDAPHQPVLNFECGGATSSASASASGGGARAPAPSPAAQRSSAGGGRTPWLGLLTDVLTLR
jgi:phospholipid/cholesterol/gamma-HCH transport system substrate-binding protein